MILEGELDTLVMEMFAAPFNEAQKKYYFKEGDKHFMIERAFFTDYNLPGNPSCLHWISLTELIYSKKPPYDLALRKQLDYWNVWNSKSDVTVDNLRKWLCKLIIDATMGSNL